MLWLEALNIALEAKLKKKAVYAKADPSSSEMGNSNLLVKSGFGESKILASIQAKRKMEDASRASQSLPRTHRRIVSIDKPRTEKKELFLDNLSPATLDTKNMLSAKSQKHESGFFVTNEMVNLGYGKTSTHRETVKESLTRSRYMIYTHPKL